jgi:hypothetical protein
MTVVDLLEWIERRRVTGKLVVDGDSLTRTFTIETGAVVGASSTEPTEQLGQILRGAGHVDDQALATSMADAAGGGPLGARLVEHGVVAPEQLRAALLTKIRESLCDLLLWKEGTFDFEPGSVPAPAGVRAVVAVSDVLALGARRAARWPEIRSYIPDDDTAFRRIDAVDPRDVAPAKSGIDDVRLLTAVARGSGVRALVAALGGERFNVLDRLATFVAAGVLEPMPESTMPLTPAEHIAEAEQLALAGAWDRALTAAPDNKTVASVYRRIERARVADLAHALLIGPDGRAPVPVLRRGAAELDELELADLERRLLHAVDGRWDLLTLVQHAPVRAAEALVVFARLLDRGIVELT